MPRAKKTPGLTPYRDLTPETISALIDSIRRNSPEMSEAKADAELYVALEGILSFQFESKGVARAFGGFLIETAQEADNAKEEGRDPAQAEDELKNGFQVYQDIVKEYADAIAENFPSLAPQMEYVVSQSRKGFPDSPPFSPFVEALASEIEAAFDAAEIEIVAIRKKHAKQKVASDKAPTYSVRTGSPAQAAIRAIGDCIITREGTLLNTFIDRGSYDNRAINTPRHHHLGHQVIFKPSNNETIEELLKLGGSTACFVFIYIEELIRLAAAAGRSDNERSTPWVMVDIADVVKKTMGEIKNREDLLKAKQKVWDALRLVDNTYVLGERKRDYTRNIETKIASKIFVMGSEERPGDWTPSRWMEPPLRVQMTVTPEWLKQMKTGPISEYLPFVEILGAIPGGKAGAAWARCLGLAWLYHCRRYAAKPDRFPTRQELLDSPLSDVSPYFEVLEGENPQRAIEYFKKAEDKLIELGFLMPFPKPRKEKDFTGYNWDKEWLSETLTDWKAGPRILGALEEVNAKRPAPALVDFNAPKPAKKAAQRGKK